MDLETIKDIVCVAYKITKDELCSKSRIHLYVMARECYCHFARKYTLESTIAIGSAINRHHSTIIMSAQAYKNDFAYDFEFKKTSKEIEKAIKERMYDEA